MSAEYGSGRMNEAIVGSEGRGAEEGRAAEPVY